MATVYIVDCVRTAVGKGRADGMYQGYHPVELLALTLDELMTRTGVPKDAVQDIVGGVVAPVAEQGANVPRLAALKAGFPVSVPGVQLNRMCGSSQQAVHFAAQAIAAGDMDVAIGCGVEMMGVVKMGADSNLMSGQLSELDKALYSNFPFRLLHQGVSADMIAKKYGIARHDCDELAVRSHTLAAKATGAGLFKAQLVPIKSRKDGALLDKDEGIRFPVDVGKLGQLKTVFSTDGVVTAGNASQISDGAGAVLLCSEAALKKYNLRPRARIVARAVVGSDPELMLTGPIPATRLALKMAGLSIDQIDVVEINEAFASVVLAWQKELQIPDFDKRVNPNGGAMAHGHPLGATGAILMTKLVCELERRGARFGLQTMCIGHGQATATIIENLSCSRAKL